MKMGESLKPSTRFSDRTFDALAIGLVMAGAMAEIYSTPLAWIVGAIFLVSAAVLSLLLARREDGRQP